MFLGRHERQNGGKAYSVVKSIPHPKRVRKHMSYDLAILIVAPRIEYTYEVRPICLPLAGESTSKMDKGQKVLASGWGSLNSGGPPSQYLMYVLLDVIDYEDCRKRLITKNQDKLHENNICTWSSGKDTCNGEFNKLSKICSSDKIRIRGVQKTKEIFTFSFSIFSA